MAPAINHEQLSAAFVNGTSDSDTSCNSGDQHNALTSAGDHIQQTDEHPTASSNSDGNDTVRQRPRSILSKRHGKPASLPSDRKAKKLETKNGLRLPLPNTTNNHVSQTAYEDAFPALSPAIDTPTAADIAASAENDGSKRTTPLPTPLMNAERSNSRAGNQSCNSNGSASFRQNRRFKSGQSSSKLSLKSSNNNTVLISPTPAATDGGCLGSDWPSQSQRGQRKLGPNPFLPPSHRSQRGSEIFLRHLPHDCYETEILAFMAANCTRQSVLETVSEIRIMLDYVRRGASRGFAFILMASPENAQEAILMLNGKLIRPGFTVDVQESVDNCKLFVGSLPKTRTRDEIFHEISRLTDGVVDVTVYPSALDKSKTRGFAFVHYESHQAASHARTRLQQNDNSLLWDCVEALVDWAEPEKDCADEIMSHVKVLFVRNLMFSTTEETLMEAFSKYGRIEKVKKLKDFAFVHFYERSEALQARQNLNDSFLDRAQIEVHLAKPPPPKSPARQQQQYLMQKHHNQDHTWRYFPAQSLTRTSHMNSGAVNSNTLNHKANAHGISNTTLRASENCRLTNSINGFQPSYTDGTLLPPTSVQPPQRQAQAQWQPVMQSPALPNFNYNYYYPPYFNYNMLLSPSVSAATTGPVMEPFDAGWNIPPPPQTFAPSPMRPYSSVVPYWFMPQFHLQRSAFKNSPTATTPAQPLFFQHQQPQYMTALHAGTMAAVAASGMAAEGVLQKQTSSSVLNVAEFHAGDKQTSKYASFNPGRAPVSIGNEVIRRNAIGQQVIRTQYNKHNKQRGFIYSNRTQPFNYVSQPAPGEASNLLTTVTAQLKNQLKTLLTKSGFSAPPVIRVEQQQSGASTVNMYSCEILLSPASNDTDGQPILHCKPKQLLPSAEEAQIFALKFVINNLQQVLERNASNADIQAVPAEDAKFKRCYGDDLSLINGTNANSHDSSPPAPVA